MMDLKTVVAQVPQLARGLVWCRECGREQRADAADALRHGWPKCCGYTMTIDHPSTWNHPVASQEQP